MNHQRVGPKVKIKTGQIQLTEATEHKITFEVVTWPYKDGGYEAIGTLYTIGGCAPLGCGTDRALIGVRVKVDAVGTVNRRARSARHVHGLLVNAA
jgi:hypothetical protein